MRASSSLTWGGCTFPGDGGVPAVAVSLTGPTAAHARAQARHAIDAGADVLELRVDLLEEVDALVAFTEAPGEESSAPDSMVVTTAAAQVLECLRRMADVVDATPLLLTCRTAVEGGRARLDDSGYGALLCSVLDELAGWELGRRPSAIDVEVQRGCLPQVSEQAHGLGIDVVASFHDFKTTPADDVLEDVLSRMASEGADLAKIAVWPTGADDVARLLGVCARATAAPGKGTGLPVAAMSMGALGAVSRVAPVFGSALTFAVVPDEQGETQASAPGQLPIQDVRRCLELLRA